MTPDQLQESARVGRERVVREVLIQATDMIPHGAEPYVGWSAVLAARIVAALELTEVDRAV